MKHLDLFSGIGGFALAAKRVWGADYQNIGHSEIEKYPCKVYHKRYPESECLGDITKIDWAKVVENTERVRCNGQKSEEKRTLRRFGKSGAGNRVGVHNATIDLLTGGFPCQPHSIAGKRKGSKDERDLWSECIRAVCGVRPRYALFENVSALFTSDDGRFFNHVLADLAKNGYDAEWQVISAASVGAPHLRERVWILAYPDNTGNGTPRNGANGKRQEKNEGQEKLSLHGIGGQGEDVANSEETKCEQPGDSRAGRNGFTNKTWQESWYEVATRFCRVDDGVSYRVDRLKCLGNAIVPQVAEEIMRRIKEIT